MNRGDSPTVSIVIPVYNQLSFTKPCLQALRETTPVGSGVEIIVVDNASTDETGSFLRHESQRHSWLRVVSMPVNTGFAPASNRGAEEARGEFLVFLNNDTVPTRHWLDYLLLTLSQPGVGVAGPKLVYPDSQTINHAGYVFNSSLRIFYPIYHRVAPDFPGVNKERDFQALLGACLVMRRGTFFEAGMFAHYGLEDIDLCLKIRARGLRAVYNPLAVVWHHGSITLRFSPPGAIPATDAAEFTSRWSSNQLVDDDGRFYREDGYRVDIVEQDLRLEEVTEGSFAAVGKAAALPLPQAAPEVEALLLAALNDFPHNVPALRLLLELRWAFERHSEALAIAETLRRIEPNVFEHYVAVIELARLSGDHQRATQVCSYVSSFPELPAQAVSQLAELRKSLNAAQ